MKSSLVRAFVLAAIAVALCGSNSFGVNERLSFSQSAEGLVAVTLDGQTPYCGDRPVGAPAITISSTAITIVSAIQVGECPNPPPGFVFPPPTPYSFTANLAHLGDGTYHVVWGFADPSGHIFQSVSSTFVVAHGSLIASVPILSNVALFALAVVLAALGVAAIASRPGA